MTVQAIANKTEGELIEFLRTGDSQAMAELYNRYYEPVYRYALSLVKMKDVAEDIVHEVFLKVWEIRAQLNIQSSLKNYILRTCHNYTVDMARRLSTDRKLKEQLLYLYQEQVLENGPGPKELERMETLLQDALETLTPQQRKVYELCKKQGLTYQQAADQLGISSHTVKEHMGNVLAALRRNIRERGELGLLLLFYILYP
jgi:RNA polymerase sigma-70 factor (family 1)